MKFLVTGSSGHLGEALIRTLMHKNQEVIGADLIPSAFTNKVGSITNRAHVKKCMEDVDVVLHVATLHKPHMATHSRQDFIDTNITGTLNLLEEALAAGVKSFIFTSSTSVFGHALMPPAGAPAAWITEEVVPIPKNIYGITKIAAENLCKFFHRKYHLPCIILRTSRFFPEEDDKKEVRDAYDDKNIKTNEFLYRRVDIEDVVSAHLLAYEKATDIGFGCYIISATTPFTINDLNDLRTNAALVLKRRVPDYEAEYKKKGWKFFPKIDRVYVNKKAREELNWQPVYNFNKILEKLKTNDDIRSPLAKIIGSKGYHAVKFKDGPYPVE
jgi:UDP-glucose 4-epimerase